MLNTLSVGCKDFPRIESESFPGPAAGEPHRPLPEDFVMRGLTWTELYYPHDWFTSSKVDDDERCMEMPSMTDERKDRCLWLGRRIARSARWLTYRATTHSFGVATEFDVEIVPLPLPLPARAPPAPVVSADPGPGPAADVGSDLMSVGKSSAVSTPSTFVNTEQGTTSDNGDEDEERDKDDKLSDAPSHSTVIQPRRWQFPQPGH